ncbi:MAG TPA: hypothetical protein VGV87_01975 [Blastocatellia bacterium]|jgi:hypothetical protein|nr:hypothetical protein [Blastocatellia bacterium]
MEKPKVFINKRDAKVYDVRRPTPVEIVCGDCSVRSDEDGNAELLPYRTFLAMDGRCYTCGGGSFVIASELCGALRRTITERRQYGIAARFAVATGPSDNTSRELWAVPRQEDAIGAATVTGRRVESDLSLSPQLGARVN